MSDFWFGVVNLKNAKKKVIEELIPVALHPKRWWNYCMSEDEKNEIEAIFTEKCF